MTPDGAWLAAVTASGIIGGLVVVGAMVLIERRQFRRAQRIADEAVAKLEAEGIVIRLDRDRRKKS